MYDTIYFEYELIFHISKKDFNLSIKMGATKRQNQTKSTKSKNQKIKKSKKKSKKKI